MESVQRLGRAENLNFIRRAAFAGMLAPVIFVSVFSIEGWLRPGYDPASMFVSELSLGPRGWVQIVSFIVTGALVLVFTRGVRDYFVEGNASKVGLICLNIIGGSLIASGPFVTDRAALFNQVSVHGVIHGVFGALVFSLASVSCFVYFGRFKGDFRWRSLAIWTLLAGIFLVVGIGFLKASQFPSGELYAWKGLIQRAILIIFMAWLFAFAARMFRYPLPTTPDTSTDQRAAIERG
ncbi:DUF998 domain-containing protein [Deinococcus sp.]|uniref:DUF998 domain-containing protein n=1 Tax=Deinococcus sp. TaxID=47478 RepID=UPI003CC59B55